MNWITETFPLVDSTNALCKQKALENAPEGYTAIAKSQTHGRGRLGRTFFSPDGSGLYMSFLLRPAFSPALFPRLTPLAAVAVCRALKKEARVSPGIKWVNDVYLNGKKLCGILTQGGQDPQGRPWVVVGIGVNLVLPQEGFPHELSSLACALYPSHPDPDGLRATLARYIQEEFASLYRDPMAESAVEEYRRLCFLFGRSVTVLQGEQHYLATALDVDDSFRLKVKKEDGSLCSLEAGEVSLKV